MIKSTCFQLLKRSNLCKLLMLNILESGLNQFKCKHLMICLSLLIKLMKISTSIKIKRSSQVKSLILSINSQNYSITRNKSSKKLERRRVNIALNQLVRLVSSIALNLLLSCLNMLSKMKLIEIFSQVNMILICLITLYWRLKRRNGNSSNGTIEINHHLLL